jgi:hypothetical protein
MLEREALFNKEGNFTGFTDEQLAELREDFVRRRFAEEQIFGREDIEEWFERSAQNKLADETWKKLASSVAFQVSFRMGSSLQELLCEYGARLGLDVSIPEEWQKRRNFYWFLKSLQEKGFNLFLLDDDVAVLEGEEVFILRPSMFINLGSYDARYLLPPDVVASMFHSWNVGNKRGKAIGIVLKNWLRSVIEEVRKEAEDDFDQALTISLDGKIKNADTLSIGESPGYQIPREVLPLCCKVLWSPENGAVHYRADHHEGIPSFVHVPFSLLPPLLRKNLEGGLYEEYESPAF